MALFASFIIIVGLVSFSLHSAVYEPAISVSCSLSYMVDATHAGVEHVLEWNSISCIQHVITILDTK